MEVLRYVIEFFLALVLSFVIQKLFVGRKFLKSKDNSKKDAPPEMIILLKLADLKLEDINKKKTLNVLYFVNSLDISIALLLTELTTSVALKLLIAAVSVLILLIVSYRIVASIYLKKGKK